jgi:hypothetical protein
MFVSARETVDPGEMSRHFCHKFGPTHKAYIILHGCTLSKIHCAYSVSNKNTAEGINYYKYEVSKKHARN